MNTRCECGNRICVQGLCERCYRKTPEQVSMRRRYQQRPDVKAKHKKYMQIYNQRPEIIARRKELAKLAKDKENKEDE